VDLLDDDLGIQNLFMFQLLMREYVPP